MDPRTTLERFAPRLTVSILTRNAAPRIADRIAEARSFADEVIVGVDAASTDETFETASTRADVVYRFRHPGQLAPARLLPLEYATGEWILSLDDDESIEESFTQLLPELLSDTAVTHYFFPRKWIVNLDPCEYAHTSPWFPDWQLRLFRNDAALVWKPPQPHSGYRVQGTGYREARVSILHFEPVWCDPVARAAKLQAYRAAGAENSTENFYESLTTTGTERRAPCRLRKVPNKSSPGRVAPRIESTVRELELAKFPGWDARLSSVKLPDEVCAGQEIIAEISAFNQGTMAWPIQPGSWAPLNLSFHLLDAKGRCLQFDGPRFPVPRATRPGQSALILAAFAAPAEPGDYLLEWDMVSEGECWFRDCGSTVLRTPLRVARAAAAAVVDSRPPFPFIVGVPRSGTTLIRMMLDSHSQMAIPSGTHFFFDLVSRNESSGMAADEFVELLTTHFTWPDFHLAKDEFCAAVNALAAFNVADGLRTFYRLYAARFGKERFGEKTPDYGNIMPAIETLLPEARFLHIIRDGRDVAVSKRPLWFGAGQDISAQAKAWAEQVRMMREIGRRCRHYLEFRFEELVRNPPAVLKTVCEFLELPFEEKMLRYHERAPSRLQEVGDWPSQNVTAEQRRSLHSLVQRPPLQERIGRWKRELTETELAAYEAVAGECLQELGYEIAGG